MKKAPSKALTGNQRAWQEEIALERIRANIRPHRHEVDDFYGAFRLDLLRRIFRERLRRDQVRDLLIEAMPTFPKQASVLRQEIDHLSRPAIYPATYSWHYFEPVRRAIAEALEVRGIGALSATPRELADLLRDEIDHEAILAADREARQAHVGAPGSQTEAGPDPKAGPGSDRSP